MENLLNRRFFRQFCPPDPGSGVVHGEGRREQIPEPAIVVIQKAKANLKASKKLLGADLVDPAMSRLYYALFQAGVHALRLAGKKPEDFKVTSRGKWGHDIVCGNISVLRPQRNDVELFREARLLRERADYDTIPVIRQRVVDLLPKVEEFVREVCG